MLLYIAWGVGFALCVLSILLILLFHKKDKKKLVPIIMYVLGFVLFMGSGFLHWKGIELKLPEKKPEDDVQQTDIDDTNSAPDNQEPVDFMSIIGDSSAQFSKEVPNDVTGRWRLFVYNSSENIVDHAVEYYNEYFDSDDEVHLVVNRELQTTTVINAFSGSLSVDVHEYIDDEETDAKILGGGTLLDSYMINISSGEMMYLTDSEPTVSPDTEPSSDSSGTLGDYYVEVKDAVIATTRDGEPAIVVTYSWTNNSEETTNADVEITEKAFQNGIELDRSFDSSIYDSKFASKDLRPGASLDVQCAFLLTDESAVVEFELYELFSMSDDIVSKDFDPTQLG